jgi:hypothetical protein
MTLPPMTLSEKSARSSRIYHGFCRIRKAVGVLLRRVPLPGDIYYASRRFALGLLEAGSTVTRVTTVIVFRLFWISDYWRWSNAQNLETLWDSRTERIAKLVPMGSRVIEFGPGRRLLERLLHDTCHYIPSDLVDRGPGTIICDLNRRPLPDLRYLRADIAVFGGVLEYVIDLESVVEWLSRQVSCCIASYVFVTSSNGIAKKIRERGYRLYHGYMNHYREDELIQIFDRYGFSCVKTDTWPPQRIFLFHNRSAVPATHPVAGETL